MADHTHVKGDAHFDTRRIAMQSADEVQQWMRYVPQETPAGYRTFTRWVQPDPKKLPVLEIGTEKVPDGEPPKPKPDAAAVAKQAKLLSVIAGLQNLTDADLQTKAAELSIASPPKKRPQLVEAVARKIQAAEAA